MGQRLGHEMQCQEVLAYLLRTKTKSIHFYTVEDHILEQVQDNPYLGITGPNDISKKANSTFGFLRRNLCYCPVPCRKNAYLALVRSKLEYGSIAWVPYMYLKCDIDRLDRVQRTAVRFITGAYKSRQEGCVTKMLTNLGLPALEFRREATPTEADVSIQGGERAHTVYQLSTSNTI